MATLCLGLFISFPRALQAQQFQPADSSHQHSVIHSLDSLLTSMHLLRFERAEMKQEFNRLTSRIQELERKIDREAASLNALQDSVLYGIDSLRVLMPSEEPMRRTSNNVLYLSQRQDSMVAQIERLEERVLSLPDKHYWGVRNGFKQFDHLLLFTFLGAITSLGVVLLVKGGPRVGDQQMDPVSYQEAEADRMSVSITLLVGSVLVILFILFIL